MKCSCMLLLIPSKWVRRHHRKTLRQPVVLLRDKKAHVGCRYDFETDAGLRVTMAAAARQGKVFFAGGTAPIDGWSAAAPALQEAVGSFRLLKPVRNV